MERADPGVEDHSGIAWLPVPGLDPALWRSAEDFQPLPDPELADLWLFSQDQSALMSAAFWPVLHPEEQARARRMADMRQRRRFVIRRAVLRMILARYTGTKPSDLLLAHNQHGKPFIVGSDLHFNLSDSHHLVLVAVARRPIGVDVQWMDPGVSVEEIAALHFSAAERSVLVRLSATEGQKAFFQCWTRKEAIVKAAGQGLAWDLAGIEAGFQGVTTGTFPPACITAGEEADREFVTFVTMDLALPEGYAGALSALQPLSWLRCWHYSPLR